MTLIDVQRRSSYFSLKMNVAYIPGPWLSSGDLMMDDIADDLEWPWKSFSGTVYDQI